MKLYQLNISCVSMNKAIAVQMINYNFKDNWEQMCMPLIRTEAIQLQIKIGVRGFNRSIKREQKTNGLSYSHMEYKKYDYPLKYSRGDFICGLTDEIEARVTSLLIERNILKPDENEAILNEFELDEYAETDNYELYQKYKQSVIEPYVNAECDKDYRYYCLFGGCHWYNKSFGLTLAKMVMPTIEWKIIEGGFHTTVVSLDEKLVFDILYYDDTDIITFGGQKAIYEARRLI